MKLLISILIDIIGLLSYLIPFGEFIDIIFAPLQAWWIYWAYGTKRGACYGLIEEILPFSDFIPMCTIVHVYKRYKKR